MDPMHCGHVQDSVSVHGQQGLCAKSIFRQNPEGTTSRPAPPRRPGCLAHPSRWPPSRRLPVSARAGVGFR